jgi:hypothetical protein
MDDWTEFYEKWQDLPRERLLALSERAIRELEMQEIMALRIIFRERYEKELKESHLFAV